MLTLWSITRVAIWLRSPRAPPSGSVLRVPWLRASSCSCDASHASRVSSPAHDWIVELDPRAEAGAPRSEPVCGEGLSPRSASGGEQAEQEAGHAGNIEIARLPRG